MLWKWFYPVKIFVNNNNRIIIIYGKEKNCWNNLKTNFSDSKVWPGELKNDMKY